MEINKDRIDETVLALLQLTAHGSGLAMRTWKSHDWDVLGRLHDKGYISNPRGKAKSVAFSEEGRKRSEELFRSMFGT